MVPPELFKWRAGAYRSPLQLEKLVRIAGREVWMSGKKKSKTATWKSEAMSETEHLLQSPKNAERLLKAMEQAKAGTGKPQTIEELRKDLGIDPAD
jgi:hypothetical protein